LSYGNRFAHARQQTYSSKTLKHYLDQKERHSFQFTSLIQQPDMDLANARQEDILTTLAEDRQREELAHNRTDIGRERKEEEEEEREIIPNSIGGYRDSR
jgi:hypothetical protein